MINKSTSPITPSGECWDSLNHVFCMWGMGPNGIQSYTLALHDIDASLASSNNSDCPVTFITLNKSEQNSDDSEITIDGFTPISNCVETLKRYVKLGVFL